MRHFTKIMRNSVEIDFDGAQLEQLSSGPGVRLTFTPTDPAFELEGGWEGDRIDVLAGRGTDDGDSDYWLLRAGTIIKAKWTYEFERRAIEVSVDAFGDRLSKAPEEGREELASAIVGGSPVAISARRLVRAVYERLGFKRVLTNMPDWELQGDVAFRAGASFHGTLQSLLDPWELYYCYDPHAEILYLVDALDRDGVRRAGFRLAVEDQVGLEIDEQWTQEKHRRIVLVLADSADDAPSETYEIKERDVPQEATPRGAPQAQVRERYRRYYRRDDPDQVTTREIVVGSNTVVTDRTRKEVMSRAVRTVERFKQGTSLPELETWEEWKRITFFSGTLSTNALLRTRTGQLRTEWEYDEPLGTHRKTRDYFEVSGLVLIAFSPPVPLDEAMAANSIPRERITNYDERPIWNGFSFYRQRGGTLERTGHVINELSGAVQEIRAETIVGAPTARGGRQIRRVTIEDEAWDPADDRLVNPVLTEWQAFPYRQPDIERAIRDHVIWRNHNALRVYTFSPAKWDTSLYRGQVLELETTDGTYRVVVVVGFTITNDFTNPDEPKSDFRVTCVDVPAGR